MALDSATLGKLDTTREVLVVTRSKDRTYSTIIWVVVEDGEVFVRSVRGDGGRWYQRANVDQRVDLIVGGETIPFHAVAAADEESIERTSQALRGKYSHSQASLERMLRPEVLHTTMRLDPVD